MAVPLPKTFKSPTIEKYDGEQCPEEHLRAFHDHLDLYGVQDAIKCRAFSITLKGSARAWYGSLPQRSISNFDQLSQLFRSHYVSSKKFQKTSAMLMKVKQGPQESLKNYLHRFNAESVSIPNLSTDFAATALQCGLLPGSPLQQYTARKSLLGLGEILSKAEGFINAEEVTRRLPPLEDKSKGKRPTLDEPDLRDRIPPKRRDRDTSSYSQFQSFTPLNASRAKILYEIQDHYNLPTPPQMRAPPGKRLSNKYCNFHKDHGHDTESCWALKE